MVLLLLFLIYIPTVILIFYQLFKLIPKLREVKLLRLGLAVLIYALFSLLLKENIYFPYLALCEVMGLLDSGSLGEGMALIYIAFTNYFAYAFLALAMTLFLIWAIRNQKEKLDKKETQQ